MHLTVCFWTIPTQYWFVCVDVSLSLYVVVFAIKILDLELIRQSFGFITKSINDYKHSLPQCNWVESTWHHSIICYYQFSHSIIVRVSSMAMCLCQCVPVCHSFGLNGTMAALWLFNFQFSTFNRMENKQFSNDRINNDECICCWNFVKKLFLQINWEIPRQCSNWIIYDLLITIAQCGEVVSCTFILRQDIMPVCFSILTFPYNRIVRGFFPLCRSCFDIPMLKISITTTTKPFYF